MPKKTGGVTGSAEQLKVFLFFFLNKTSSRDQTIIKVVLHSLHSLCPYITHHYNKQLAFHFLILGNFILDSCWIACRDSLSVIRWDLVKIGIWSMY